MRYYFNGKPLLSLKSKTVVSVGVFDGLHIGHQQLIQRVVEIASTKGLTPLTITFSELPEVLLMGEKAPKLLTTTEEKLSLIESLGVLDILVIDFDQNFREISAHDFVKNILVELAGVEHIVIGSNFRFGKNQAGDVELLNILAEEFGFEVEIFKRVSFNEIEVSSSKIRELISSGDVFLASKLLGRNYQLRGLVVKGAGRGSSELGYPTANISTNKRRLWPGIGIYAGLSRVGGAVYKSAISIGYRPTFYEESEPIIEAYLIDFSGDLYGQEIEIEFVKKIRDEKKFGGLEELMIQIVKDVEEVRQVLEGIKT